MLAEVMAYLTAKDERERVKRSLEFAVRRKIGPFRRSVTVGMASSNSGGRPASNDFIHEAPLPSWRLGASFGSAQTKNYGLACPLETATLKEVNELIATTNLSLPSFRLSFNNVNIYLGCFRANRHGDQRGYFLIQNEENTFWIENSYGNNMNRRAALYMIKAVEKLLLDDAVVDGLIAHENSWRTSFLTREQVRSSCAESLGIIRALMPDHGPIKVTPRLTDIERAFMRHNYHGGMLQDYVIPDKPFDDAQVEVLSLPHFPQTDFGDVTAHYGAFRVQREGVIKWVQFTNIDGSSAQDFIVVKPRDSYGEHPKENMGRQEALATLRLIDVELPADHPLRKTDVLDRLVAHAKTLRPKDYSRLKIIIDPDLFFKILAP